MSGTPLPLSERARELRQRFDCRFAAPMRAAPSAAIELLAIQLGSEPCALRLASVAGLFADRRFTRLPQTGPECLGLAGFRGSVIPVYDLCLLLGGVRRATPRWLAVAAGSQVALAFDRFEGHLRVPLDAFVPQEGADNVRPHVRELARVVASKEAPLRSVIDVESVVADIRQRARHDLRIGNQEEHK